jgi:hypothetical protein
MSSPSRSLIHYGYASPSDMTWSRSEKAIARQAFDAALKRELHELMQEAKEIAGQIKQPSDLWDLQEYLTQRRKRTGLIVLSKQRRQPSHLPNLMCQ